MFDKKLEFTIDGNFVLIQIVENNKKEIYRVPKSAFNSAMAEYEAEKKRG